MIITMSASTWSHGLPGTHRRCGTLKVPFSEWVKKYENRKRWDNGKVEV